MNRRKFLTLSVLLACHPQLSFADGQYVATGSKIPVDIILSTDSLNKLINEMDRKNEKIKQQAANSSPDVIVKAYQNFQKNTDKASKSVSKLERKLDATELNLAFSYANAALLAAGATVPIGGALAVKAGITVVLGMSVGALIVPGALIAIGVAGFALSYTQLLVKQDQSSVNGMLVGRFGDYLSFLGLGKSPPVFIAAMSSLSRLMVVINTGKVLNDIILDKNEEVKIKQEIENLKGSLIEMKRIDTYEKFSKIYLNNMEETITWLKKFRNDTKATDGQIYQNEPSVSFE